MSKLYEPMCDPYAESPYWDTLWEVPEDYEVCDICGFDHTYDGCDPAVYREMMFRHQEAHGPKSQRE